VKAQLEGVKVRLAVRSGDAGRLFGSVTPADIASAIKASGGPEVDKRRIELGSPIKTLGAHETSVRLHPEVAAKVNIEVVAA
jgi:large subunit ribosomal protein L9